MYILLITSIIIYEMQMEILKPFMRKGQLTSCVIVGKQDFMTSAVDMNSSDLIGLRLTGLSYD